MRFLVIFNLFLACIAEPQGYTASISNGNQLTNGVEPDGVDSIDPLLTEESEASISFEPVRIVEAEAEESVECGPGEVQHVDGSCVEPIVNRNYFLYSAPELSTEKLPAPEIPSPKVDYNVIFVRPPDGEQEIKPIIVPPPQQKTLVYVLTKGGIVSQKVIEIPTGPEHPPEVFYISYDEDENLQLEGGLDLQSALTSADTREGIILESGAGTGLEGEFVAPLGSINGQGVVAVDENMIIGNGIGSVKEPFQGHEIVRDSANVNGVPLPSVNGIGDIPATINSNEISVPNGNGNGGVQAISNGNEVPLPAFNQNEDSEGHGAANGNKVHLPGLNSNDNRGVNGQINGNGVPILSVNGNGNGVIHAESGITNGRGYRVNRAIKQMMKVLGGGSHSENSGSVKPQPFYYYISE